MVCSGRGGLHIHNGRELVHRGIPVAETIGWERRGGGCLTPREGETAEQTESRATGATAPLILSLAVVVLSIHEPLRLRRVLRLHLRVEIVDVNAAALVARQTEEEEREEQTEHGHAQRVLNERTDTQRREGKRRQQQTAET